MSLNSRFITIDKAVLTACGNSLIVCGDTISPEINTSDMITIDGTTTRDWSKSGSSANINILDNSTILYAELIWYSTVKSNDPSALDVRSIADTPITLVTPKGTVSVNPENTDSFTAPSGSIDRFRSANVTNIIKNSLGGFYTVSNIPTSLPPSGLSNTRAGWTLVVVYRNDSFKPKKIVFYSGIEFGNENNPIQAMLTGFSTEGNEDSLRGNLFIASANGDPLDGIQTLKIGPSFAKLTTVGNPVGTPNPNPGTAPNNPWNSFFTGQINICNPLDSNMGLIYISGTNGTKNHDAFVPTQVLGARNKWDITNINISNTLVPNQNQLAGQCTVSGSTDGIELVALGAQVNSLAPDINAVLSIYEPGGEDESSVEVGEELAYLVQINNKGKSSGKNLTLSTKLDSCLSFVPNSLKINGTVQTGADITKGVNTGVISPDGVTTVVYSVRVNSMPTSNPIKSIVNYSYDFVSGDGSPTYINYASTNSITTEVRSGNLNVVKKVSSLTAIVGDTLNYTIDITNAGSETAKNITFQDLITDYCSFIKGSVSVNGVVDSSLDPNVGFNISDLLPNGTTEIIFSVKVMSIPPSTMIYNKSLVTFSYLYSGYKVPTTKTIISNNTSIQVQFVDIIGKRTNDNNYPNVDDIVTYTLRLSNVGNITAYNVQVQEPDIPGCSFVSGSVTINGTKKPTLNPFDGFTIDSIDPESTTTITYKVLVNQIQPGELIENIAEVPFKYQITPGGPVISTEKNSNKVTTRSNFVKIAIPETVDKPYATIDEILYYSINLTNTGNIDAINTLFLSHIQTDATFVQDSVKINGLPCPGYAPDKGFSIGIISPNNTVNVTFKVKVLSIPNPNIIYNYSELIYDYLPDPNGNPITNTAPSNIVQTVINKASFTITKSVDKTYAQLGDVLVYKTIISNTGTVNLTNVKFGDTISSYLKLKLQYVFINGIQYPGYDPNNGFPLGTIKPSENFEIIFAVDVEKAPSFGYVLNSSEMTYSYKTNPNSPVITDTDHSNEVRTEIVNGTLSITKTASKSYSAVNDTIKYSFNISNTGNVPVNNTTFIDYVPSAVSFVIGSVVINGISKPSFDPTVGFSLGSLTVGQVFTVSFNVTVNSIPSPNTIVNNGSASFNYHLDPLSQPISKTITSNNVTTVINAASLALTKVVDKAYATVTDILNYTVTAFNTGTVTLKNVNFTDIIPNAASFVSGSVIIDGASKSDYNPNSGFTLNDITAGSSTIINFKVQISKLPSPPVIINNANITFKYRISPNGEDITGKQTSNSVTTNINQAIINNTKTVDKTYATISDTLTYTSVITNNGNIDAANTNFVDTIPSNTTFVSGSVKINGDSYSNYDPSTGFTLGTVQPSKSVTVSFKVTVSNVPQVGYVNNSSNIYYEYKIDPNSSYSSGISASNTVTTYVNLGSLTVTKASDRSYTRLTDIVNYSFVITNTGNTILKNLSFKDIIQSESSFNSGSVFVNGVTKPTYNPNNGFNLNDIPVGNFTTISFKVTVNSIPSSGKLYNTADVKYSYYVDPNGSETIKTVTSNQTTVNVNDAIVSATKTVDKSNAKINDILTFTVTLNNAGNSAAQSVLFEDRLNSNIIFNSGSVYINGVNNTSFDPNVGFSLPDISSNTTTTVTFKATVLTRPSDNIVKNYASTNYEYKVDPGSPFIPVSLTTNTTTTYIAAGELAVNKSVNKDYASVLDILTYTVNIKNTGSVNATNLSFNDLVPASTSFKPGTVYVNGVNQSDADPNNSFTIPDLAPNQINTVSFDVHVDTLPSLGKVENTANITFSYKLASSDPIITKTATSNKVTTSINLGQLNITKTVDKNYATIFDTLNYTITLKNVGNVDCTNILFQDAIQAEGAFVTDSVIINGVSKPNLDPNTGFSLEKISANNSTTVSFSVTVNTLPANYMLYNSAKASYNYYINPNNIPILANNISNTVSTQINIGNLSVNKAVSKAYAAISDTLTYTITVTNSGNVDASTVNFRDVIPTGLTFIKDSVTIDGISKPGYNPYDSFTLGTISSGDSTIVKFDALVTIVPSPSLISNTAQVTFAYRINPAGPDIILEANSNAALTQINIGDLTLTKKVDKGYSTIGDVLTYTAFLSNTGNVDTTNAIFVDNLENEISFNKGSVVVNGENKPDFDPTVGFNIGTISTLNEVIVSFKVTVNALSPHSSIINTANSTYSYKIDPNDGTLTKSVQSNPVYTIIVVPGMTAAKVVDLSYATISDILNYTIVINNTGNTANTNLYFIDTLSNGADFVVQSVIVNGNPQPTLNPIKGFSLSNMLPGASTTVQFQAKVTSTPIPPQVTNSAVITGFYKVDPLGPDVKISAATNTVSTQINIGNISNLKSVDKAYAKVGDTVTYTNVITNTGNVIATNVLFFDTMQVEAMYIGGTVRINGVVYPSLDPTVGFSIGDFSPNQNITITFDVKINSLPKSPQIDNKSEVVYSYKIDPTSSIITKTIFSNTITTHVVLAELAANKIVDNPIATVGDTLTFTINLTNIGNVIASNVFFQDTPSTGAAFKAGSIVVNGISQLNFDPTVGFTLDNIGIGNTATVQFTANVISVPPTNKVTNQAVINFKYVVIPSEPAVSATTYSNTTTTNIALGNLNVTKAVDKQFATIGENLTYTITITNMGNIDASNVIFLDPTPQNSIFVLGSVKINGVSQSNYNPAAGFALNTMKPGEIITVAYQVQVIS